MVSFYRSPLGNVSPSVGRGVYPGLFHIIVISKGNEKPTDCALGRNIVSF